MHYPGILEILRNRFLVPCLFTRFRETFKQLFTAMLVDLISEGIESALGDLPEDICWIVHRTTATNGGWPIYELPRPTVGSHRHQAQYCQRPTADSVRIGNAQPSAGIDKSLCHHSSHKVRIEKESSWLWMNSVTSAVFCLLMLALMTILVTDLDRLVLPLADSPSVYDTIMGSAVQPGSLSTELLFSQLCCIVWLRDTVQTSYTEARSVPPDMFEENIQYLMTGNDSQCQCT